MSRVRYILLAALVALCAVACQRRPMEEQYLRVYLDLEIERDIVNYEIKDGEPGLMRVVFFDAVTNDYLSHDYVSHEGGEIFAPYGDVNMLVYNIDAGETRVRNYYSWSGIEAYTHEISRTQRSLFAHYLQSRNETRPSYEKICTTPGHLFVGHKENIHIPQHITEELFIIEAKAKTVVESWTIEIDGVSGMEWVGSVSLMLSGQVASNFIATSTPSEESVAICFDAATASRGTMTLTSRFETFGREKTSGDPALLSVLFTDVQGHPYLYNFDVSEQMEDNPDHHIVIRADVNIPKPEIGGGFAPTVDDWKEHNFNIDL